jgi:predicted nucleic acid-binding protein
VGSLTLPPTGPVYADPSIFIYSVEKIRKYMPLLAPFWTTASAGTNEVVTSELALMESLVGPYKSNDATLAADYEQTFQQGGVRAVAITRTILREAARLRAAVSSLRTPDAIHAATSIVSNCKLFETSDTGFRQVPGLPVVVLKDLLPP